MFKKSFYLAAVFSTALFASCQHDPTVLNSTWHKPGEGGNIVQKPAIKENTNQNAANHSETNSEMKPPANAGVPMSNVNSVNRTVNTNAKR